jgi:hypothetical protein
MDLMRGTMRIIAPVSIMMVICRIGAATMIVIGKDAKIPERLEPKMMRNGV